MCRADGGDLRAQQVQATSQGCQGPLDSQARLYELVQAGKGSLRACTPPTAAQELA